MSLVTVETTTTTTTTTWRRRQPPVWLLLLPLLGVLALVVVGLTSVRDRVESDLAARAAQALADDGMPVGSVSIDFSGRDGVLGGTVDEPAAADAIAATVAGVTGVRTVDASSLVLPGAGEERSSGQPAAAATPARLVLAVSDDLVVLTGTVRGTVDTSDLADAAGVATVVDGTTVQDDGGDVAGATLRLVGEVRDESTRAAILAAAQELVGADGTVDDELVAVAAEGEPSEQPVDQPPAAEASEPSTPAPSTPVPSPSVDGTGDGTASDPWIAFFNTGETTVRDFEDSVAEAVEVLPGVPAGTTVQVIGFADPRGDPEANRELSLERARVVADQLRAAAPDLDYVVDARGGAEPAATDALSRRVEIWVDGG